MKRPLLPLISCFVFLFVQQLVGQDPFITTWKTDNPGGTATNEITIPTVPGETYNYSVDWGDGSSNTGVTGNITHTYTLPGTYTVSITGTFPAIRFAGSADRGKILTIEQWGDIAWTTMQQAFSGCSNLQVPATDAPNLSGVTNMLQMFAACNALTGSPFFNTWDTSTVNTMQDMFNTAFAFNADISGWDVSNVTTMNGMFINANAFNQPIGSWDVSNVVQMGQMFSGASISFDQNLGDWDISNVIQMNAWGVNFSIANYDATLIGWATLDPGETQIPQNISFTAGSSQYCAGQTARQELSNTHGWGIVDGGLSCPGRPFITTWKTDNPGITGSNEIRIPLQGSGYNYNVDWGDGTSDTGITGVITHAYPTPGTYTVSITGDFPRIFFNGGGDKDKLISIDQWGDISWTSMDGAFSECSNLDVLALDVPDLSVVTNLTQMFFGCSTMVGNSSLTNWDVSTITNMDGLFAGTQMNQNIGSWNVSNVLNMRGMFSNNAIFNQNIASWNVTSATDMAFMFRGATAFNQNIGGWNVSSVSDFDSMFLGATAFNQDISTWNVSQANIMVLMFESALNFNQDLSNWDVSNVTNMGSMFRFATGFDQDLGSWDISNVTDMGSFFQDVNLSTENYDNTLIGWGTLDPGETQIPSNIVLLANNSQYCNSETTRQNLIDNFNWNIIDGGLNCPVDFTGAFITTWKTDNPGISGNNQITIPTNPSFTYNYVVDWGDGSSDTGVTGNITHTYSNPGIYTVSISGDFPAIRSFDPGGTSGNQFIDPEKLLSVEQWGDIVWATMSDAFTGCTNLDVVATDIPDFSVATDLFRMFGDCSSLLGTTAFSNWDVSSVTSMRAMFTGAELFNQDISGWDVSGVNNFSSMFNGASSFNQDIGGWDVSNATHMLNLFRSAESFDQDISNWDVSNVITMRSMFAFATNFNQNLSSWDVGNVTDMDSMFLRTAFNQDISNWDVSNVTGMTNMFAVTPFNHDISTWDVGAVTLFGGMFSDASAFNQDIGNWDTGSAIDVRQMFRGATAFDQSLANWDISSITLMQDMFTNAGLSLENYDATLVGWNTLDTAAGETQIPSNITFRGGNSQYCDSEAARQNLIDNFNWTITDGGLNCPVSNGFITTWQTTTANESITIPTTGSGYNYTIDWGDGTVDTNQNGNATHAYAAAGTYTVEITGDFPRIFFNNTGDAAKIQTVEQWGDIAWTSMEHAFYGCSNLDVVAGDAPDLSGVTAMDRMFEECTSLIGNATLNTWNTGTVVRMPRVFFNAVNFNQNIGGWDTSAVVLFSQMFSGASSFNQDIGSWITSSAENMFAMFDTATAFNQNIGNWDVGLVTNMNFMFSRASAFNQNIGSWNVGNVTVMDGMFAESAFNQDIGNWDVSKVRDMSGMFRQAAAFNQDIGNWNVSGVREMPNIFSGASAFNQDIGNWDVSGVTQMLQVFQNATAFNQDIGNWDTGSAIDVRQMFRGATAFDQSLANWDISSITLMQDMFTNAGLSLENYDATLVGWNTLDTAAGETQIPSNITFGGGNSEYCDGEAARQNLIDNFNWTITDGGLNCPVSNGFITTWQTTTVNESITIPTSGTGYDYSIDWGDGTVENNVTGEATHTYAAAGVQTISITGTFPRLNFRFAADQDKILTIEQWGATQWDTMEEAFWGCANLEVVATDVPDLSNVSTLKFMFNGCTSMVGNSSFNTWDTRTITNMEATFLNAASFNSPIGDWNTSGVTIISSLFLNASAFNQPIGNWDMSQVTQMFGVFNNAAAFNQPLENWDTSKVFTFDNMFNGATAFNQPLNNWDVTSASSNAFMFANTDAFDQPLGDWDISAFVSMNNFFAGAGLSRENYDTTLIGWATLNTAAGETQIPTNITFSGGNSLYCTSETQRQDLIDNFNWTITDGGLDPACNDTEAPVISCPQTIIVFAPEGELNIPVGIPELPTAIDNVSSPENITFTGERSDGGPIPEDDQFELFPVGDVIITWTATDEAGNASETCEQLVSIAVADAGGSLDVNGDLTITDTDSVSDDTFTLSIEDDNLIIESSSGLQIGGVGLVQRNARTVAIPLAALQSVTIDGGGGNNLLTLQAGLDLDSDQISLIITNTDVEIGGNGVIDLADLSMSNGNFASSSDVGIIVNAPPNTFTNATLSGNGTFFGFDVDINADANVAPGSSPGILTFDVDLNFNSGSSFDAEVNGTTPGTEHDQLVVNGDVVLNSPTLNLLGGYANGAGDEIILINNDGSDAVTGTFAGLAEGASVAFGDFNGTISYIGGDGNDVSLLGASSMDPSAFVTTWTTFTSGESGQIPTTTVTIPTVANETYNFDIDWGDGTIDTNVTAEITHDYGTAGMYTISITGTFPRFLLTNLTQSFQLLSIENWGDIAWSSMENAFAKSINLKVNAQDAPDLSQVTSLRGMFQECLALEGNDSFNTWDVSTITDMSSMFLSAQLFDQDLDGWNTSNVIFMQNMFEEADAFNGAIAMWNVANVENMQSMFNEARAFNQPIGNWNVAKVTNMRSMFFTATGFNQPLDNWDVSAVNTMVSMFHSAVSFNQDLNQWDVSNVASMDFMFNDAQAFNGNVSDWDVGSVVNMSSMFQGARDFDQAIGNWNVSNVRNMSSMFGNCSAFNQDLNAWDVSNVTDMQFMFGRATSFNGDISNWNVSQVISFNSTFTQALAFNQDIGNWDVSAATSMSNMFSLSEFNQDIGNWDVSQVTDMDSMFEDNEFFDQSLGNWNVGQVTTMRSMFLDGGMSTENYDSTLIGWSQLPSLQSNVAFGTGSFFCNANIARQSIIDTYGWTISDSGVDPNCVLDTEAPVITCPPLLSVNAGGSCQTMVTLTDPTATDNVSANFTFTATRQDGFALNDPFFVGETIVEWTATDEAGNVSESCNQSIVVNGNDDCWAVLPALADLQAADIRYTQIEFDASGTPYLVVIEARNMISFVRTFQRTTSGWTELATNLAGSGTEILDVVDLAINPVSNEPYLVYRTVSDGRLVNVRRFDGTDWVLVGAFLDFPNDPRELKIEISNSGVPFVSFLDINNGGGLNVQKFENGFWSIVGTSNFTSGDIRHVDLKLDTAGNPYVFNIRVETDPNIGVLEVHRLDNGTWQALPAFGTNIVDINNIGDSFNYELSGNNTPYVFFKPVSSEITGIRLENTTWEALPTLTVGAASFDLSTVLDGSNVPYLATKNGNIGGFHEVYRLEGASWQLVGNNPFTIGEGATQDLNFDPNGGLHFSYVSTQGVFVQNITPAPLNLDTEPPVITCPDDIEVVIPSTETTALITLVDPTATDNITAPENIVFEGIRQDDRPLTDPYPLTGEVISWKAVDEAGNESTFCEQGISVFQADTETILAPDGTLDISDGGTPTDDSFTIASDGTNLILTNTSPILITGDGVVQQDANTVLIPLSGITNGLTIDGGEGNNTLILDSSLQLLGPDNGLTLNNVNTQLSGTEPVQLNALNLANGTLDLNGVDVVVTTATNVFDGGILAGNGSISGTINFGLGAFLAPGASPGIVGFGDLVLENGSTFEAEVNGTVPGTEHDQVVVTGTVTINGATLDLMGGYANGVGDEIILIANDEADAVTGTFTGLAEGAAVAFGDFTGIISYVGGDGNDVSLIGVQGLIPGAFVTTWKTDNPGVSANNEIAIPVDPAFTYNYSVDWGDGTSDANVTGGITHTYSTAGTYDVSITGDFPAIRFANFVDPPVSDSEKILLVKQWGSIAWQSFGAAFEGCSSLDVIATDTPDLSGVTQVFNMFRGCTNLIGNSTFGNWDMSNIMNMGGMFVRASSFNQPIGSWDVSAVTDMRFMFFRALAFNQPLNNWNVSSVSDMESMFALATTFDQVLGNWDISSLTVATSMLEATALSSDNYDLLLNGWATLDTANGETQIPSDVSFGVGTIQFTNAGSTARQDLITNFNWNISDGGEFGQAPQIIALFPERGATEVALDAELIITFDRTMQIGPGSPSMISDVNVFGEGLNSGTQIRAEGNQVFLTPLDLDPNANVLIAIGDQVFSDNNGVFFPGLSGTEEWRFSTLTTVDAAPPMASFSPVSSTIDVLRDQTFTISFDEEVVNNVEGGAPIAFLDENNNFIGSIFSDAYSLSTNNGQSVISFQIPEAIILQPNSLYKIDIGEGDFEDLAGNDWEGTGIVNGVFDPGFNWQFTTSPNIDLPTEATLDPPTESALLPLDQVFTVTFNELMQIPDPDATIDLLEPSLFGGASVFQSFSVNNGALSLTDDGQVSTLTITPPEALPANKALRISIPNGFLQDTNGNAWQGTVGSDFNGFDWQFTSALGDTPCTSGDVDYEIVFDDFAGEFSWQLTDASGNVIDSAAYTANESNTTLQGQFIGLADGVYTLTLNDTFGDGICCGAGFGAFTLSKNGVTIIEGGAFGLSQTFQFCIDASVDAEVPVITCPTDISQDAGASCSTAVALIDPTATDNVSTNFVFEGVRSDGLPLTDPFFVGTTTISWTAEDEAGNISETCAQTVTITGGGDCWLDIGPEITGSPGSRVGFGVTLNAVGDIAAYVQPNANGEGNLGNVFVLQNDNGTWNPLGNTSLGGFGDSRGFSGIDLNDAGDRLAVSVDSGKMRVYEFNGSVWQQLGNDIPSGGQTLIQKLDFDASGNYLAAGYASENNSTGAVLVYQWSGGQWQQLGQTLTGGGFGDNFGRDVSLNTAGTRLAVGAYQVDKQGFGLPQAGGYVQVFELDNGSWVQLGSDLVADAVADFFGISVGLNDNGDRLVVGANAGGYAKVFEFNNGDWAQQGANLVNQPTQQPGYQVDMNGTGDVVLIGDFGQPARVFEWNGALWQLLGQAIFQNVGQDCAINKTGDIVILGGPESASGKVGIFEYAGVLQGPDTEAPVITCPDTIELVIGETETSANAMLTDPTATDNISTDFTFEGTRSDALPLSDPFPLGTTTISWTATDQAGNTSTSCDQLITVVIAESEAEVTDGDLSVKDCTNDTNDAYEVLVEDDFLVLSNNAPIIVNGDGVEQRDANTVAIPLDGLTTITINGGNGSDTLTLPVGLDLAAIGVDLITDNIDVVVDGEGPVELTNLDVSNGDFSIGEDAIVNVGGEANFFGDATLSGTGEINGAVNMNVDSTLAPGTSPGILSSDDLLLDVGSIFEAEVNGPIPGTEHDQMVVTGTVTINGATLNLLGGYTATVGDEIVLIDNDDTDPVSGTFADLPEGAAVTFGAFNGTITYVGGDGNDVSLIGGEAPPAMAFVTTWKTDNPGVSEDNEITIPTFSGEAYNYTVDWGDGNSDTGITGTITHTYATPGTYTVSISGAFPRIFFNTAFGESPGDEQKILTVEQWGSTQWTSMERAFSGCINLDVVASDTPDLSNVTSLFGMFGRCGSLIGTPTFGNWDVSNITNMNAVFSFASSFNQDIGAWNVGNVTDMTGMFSGATSFNQNIGSWDVSNVMDMSGMFQTARAFNQDIGNWQVSQVKDMGFMFSGANTFNQDLNAWDVGNVENMQAMFQSTSFDSPIGSWNVSKVTDMNNMFRSSRFKQPVGNWDVGAVTDMSFMFYESRFDQPIGNWNVSSVNTMESMFYRAQFDQDINNWDVSSVTTMESMFGYAESFDKDLDNWDVSAVTTMRQMFLRALNFNGRVDTWDVGNVTNMQNLFGGAEEFNQDVGDWDVSSVIDMSALFAFSSFDQDIGNWDVSNVQDMGAMFRNSGFDQDIGNWDVSNVTNMARMFDRNGFNQDISNWDVSSVTNMEEMFTGDFDQDIGSWDVSNVTNMNAMFIGRLSNENYDRILIGWSQLPSLQPNVQLGASNAYCRSAEARQSIIDTYGWMIQDQGENCPALSVLYFNLIDADANTVIRQLNDGDVIDVNTLSTMNLNIEAVTSDDVESTELVLSGTQSNTRIENVAPYALFGDNNSNFNGNMFDAGNYNITATPYSGNRLRGNQGTPLSINFELIDGPTADFEVTFTEFRQPTTCGGDEGLVIGTMVGPLGSYEIDLQGPVSFSEPLTIEMTAPDTTFTLSFLIAGDYVFSVTQLSTGNTLTLEFTLEDPPLPEVTLATFANVLETDTAFELTGGSPEGGVYSGPGVSNGMFDPGVVGAGTFEIVYTFTDPITNCENSAAQSITVGSNDVNAVTGFVLVNADTDEDIGPITDGATFVLTDLPTTNLNIRANTTNDVESVLLQITGGLTNTRTENVAPYALYGDINEDYNAQVFDPGTYTVTATPYTGNRLRGVMGAALTVSFSIVVPQGAAQPNTMRLYPNPATESVSMEFELPTTVVSFQVYDITGRLIREVKAEKQSGEYQMPVFDLPVGNYIIRTMDVSGTTFTQQMVIER